MGTFVTQTSDPTVFPDGDKSTAPGVTYRPGWTSDNVLLASEANTIKNALLDLRTAVRGVVVNVKNNGALGDGSTADTTAIQEAVTAAAALVGAAVYFPPGTYVMGQVTIPANTNLTIFGHGLAKLKLTGANAGFWFSSTADHVGTTITGLYAEGDGVAASAQALVQNNSGAGLYDVRIINNRVKNTTIGISLNADLTGGLSAHKNCTISGNYVEGAVGTSSGQGYGIHVASGHGETVPMNCLISGNRVVGAQRHSIYVAKGWGVTVSGNAIRDHRTGVADGTQREALSIARGGNVIASGNLFDNCADGNVGVWADTSIGIKSVLVSGNVFARPGNTFPMVMVGTTDPANEGGVEDVEISSNRFRLGATNLSAIRVNHGKHIDIHHNIFRGTGASCNGVVLYGTGESGASSTYSDEIVIERNRFRLGAGSVSVRLESDFGGSTARLDLIRNRSPGGITDLYQSGGAAISNTGIYVDGQTVDGITITAPVVHKWFPGHGGVAGGGAVRPTVSGSRGANAALQSLLTALAGLGLITDSTS